MKTWRATVVLVIGLSGVAFAVEGLLLLAVAAWIAALVWWVILS